MFSMDVFLTENLEYTLQPKKKLEKIYSTAKY